MPTLRRAFNEYLWFPHFLQSTLHTTSRQSLRVEEDSVLTTSVSPNCALPRLEASLLVGRASSSTATWKNSTRILAVGVPKVLHEKWNTNTPFSWTEVTELNVSFAKESWTKEGKSSCNSTNQTKQTAKCKRSCVCECSFSDLYPLKIWQICILFLNMIITLNCQVLDLTERCCFLRSIERSHNQRSKLVHIR